MKKYILVVVLLFSVFSFYSQLDYRGWKTWQSLSGSYKINKKSTIEGVLSSRNRHALTTLDQLFLDLSYNRELKKKQSLSFGYRLVFDNEEFKNQIVNRFNIDYSYRYKIIKKHYLIFRNRVQAKVYYDKEISFLDRLRLKYTYKYKKKIDVSFYTEGFYRFNNGVSFYKYRIGTSINYKLYKRLKLGVKYILMNEIM